MALSGFHTSVEQQVLWLHLHHVQSAVACMLANNAVRCAMLSSWHHGAQCPAPPSMHLSLSCCCHQYGTLLRHGLLHLTTYPIAVRSLPCRISLTLRLRQVLQRLPAFKPNAQAIISSQTLITSTKTGQTNSSCRINCATYISCMQHLSQVACQMAAQKWPQKWRAPLAGRIELVDVATFTSVGL